jgi:hypothetical protein
VAFSVLAVTISLMQARRPGSVLSRTKAAAAKAVPVAPVNALPSAPVAPAPAPVPAAPATR